MTSSDRRKPNIVLIGFSTTGKSRAGWLLAQRIGWSFIDTDAWVAGMARKSISAIFEEHGELHFRELERLALEEALAREGTVIATGGGVVEYATNRKKITERGWVILLEAKPETILARMRAEDAASEVPIRPLLAGNDSLRRIRRLKEERQPLYNALADAAVATDELTIEGTVEHVMSELEALGAVVGDSN
jgi:shikimate kinase